MPLLDPAPLKLDLRIEPTIFKDQTTPTKDSSQPADEDASVTDMSKHSVNEDTKKKNTTSSLNNC